MSSTDGTPEDAQPIPPDEIAPPTRRGPADARELAAELLARSRATGPFIADLFDEMAEASGLEPRDRHLAHELATGVVRHRRTLDCVLNAFCRRPLVKSPPPLRILARLGAYQLLFLDRIPDHAAVDRTVELSKKWARTRIKKHPASIASFINGLLRAVATGRQVIELAAGCSRRRVIERPTANGFALIDRDVFADPKESPGEYLADAYSFDSWVAGRWVERFGLDDARRLARAQNRRPGLTLRVNTLRIDVANVQQMLEGDGVRTVPVRPGLTLLRVLEGEPLSSKAMMMGLIQPQDPWAASVAAKLDVKAGMTVLDRCAAPGTKTNQLVELMGDKGLIVAVDDNPHGLERVLTGSRRMGGHIVRAVAAADMPAEMLKIGPVDRALVDVPCSNSGVLARRPEARWRLGAESMA
ncbi:MAG: transcription antitermination factor NusB, partial [Phycisphaerae bacterium]|nr:transcription antitermination factor NusB [Phycisphaerae bacterium]